MIKTNKKNQEKGFALLLIIILILSVSLIISLGLAFLVFNSLIGIRERDRSFQSYYTAEAGIEDSLLRLKKSMQFSSPNTLAVGNSAAVINISNLIGGSRTITSEGNKDNRVRKITTTFILSTDQVSFYYGAQVDVGGVQMGNNSQIQGNVFSNGSILPSGGGTSNITGTASIAINGNKIENVNVGGDVYVHSCKNSTITGTLHYVSGGSIVNCSFGSSVDMGPSQIASQNLPISLAQITKWKNEAAAGGIISGDYTLGGGGIDSLGPIKITGNMLIDNNSILTMTGVIYVEGNITIQNNSMIQVDSSFGSLSGVIISDGKILVKNNAILQGSGTTGSFLMLLSTNNSVDPLSPAIDVNNNAQGAVFYASNGAIRLRNNIQIREATGYKLILDNNAVIQYNSGLANVNFFSGPGGSWQAKDWYEIN
jgi:hypothetical protein